ncbi:MAG: acyltransferase [Pseudomonadota bacterium]
MPEIWHWPARLRALVLRGFAPLLLARVGPGVRIHRGLRVARPFSRIFVQAGAVLKRDVFMQTARQARIDIGAGALLNTGCHVVASASIWIGRGVRIGEFTSIRDQEHIPAPGRSVAETGFRAAPISIGDNVWIGRGCYIGPGTRIGEGAVVGANSVVKGDVPPGVLVAGAPAKVKRHLGPSGGLDRRMTASERHSVEAVA